ncbi:MAG TPA: M48 family metallopeptidase, partial [Chthoniobacterales bacterium]|nr:M48 family metallopeptidase [Chthoniobacterales bacterium]
QLSAGGSAVAEMLGGRLVNPNSIDYNERKLLNVVEEMAIASGIPAPQVYVMDDEPGINAFAAGRTTGDAVVAVTDGALRLLTRDELQGVIGHEFSHVVNGDMRLNLRLIGLIFGILCLAVIGRMLLQTRGRKNPLPLLGLALILIGSAGVFFGRLIQAAVSRQREHLADASAVQFTRNPGGLASALKKIGGLSQGSRIESAHAEETSHLFFANGVRGSFFGLMSTHPPLEERIRELDPSFDGTYPQITSADVAEPAIEPVPPPETPPKVPPPLPTMIAVAAAGIPPQTVLPSVGRPSAEQLEYATQFRDTLSETVRAATRNPLGASALIYALLLSEDETVRNAQHALLAQKTEPGAADETIRLWNEVRTAESSAKIPLIDLALPALRTLSLSQYEQFRIAVDALIATDQQVDLFEYMLQKVVMRHLEPHFTPKLAPIVQYYDLVPLVDDCGVVLTAMAYAGQNSPDEAQAAFNQGAELLNRAAGRPIPFVPADQCDMPKLDVSLNRLSQAVPQIKKNVINACAVTLGADGEIRVPETDLIRAIADALDCPVPPFVVSA